MFSRNIYVSRRQKLIKSVKEGLLLFLGNGEAPLNYSDNQYTFRQDSTWLYYFGRKSSATTSTSTTSSGWVPSPLSQARRKMSEFPGLHLWQTLTGW